MKRTSKLKFGLFLLALIALTNVSFKSSPNNSKIQIIHFTGNGANLLSVPATALQGHAQHGDVYLSTLCWVGEPENFCR